MAMQNNFMRHFRIIWLDEKIKNPGNQRRVKYLAEIGANIKLFDSIAECVNYILDYKIKAETSRLLFIVSGNLSERAIQIINDSESILCIFVFCANKDNHQLNFTKLHGIYDDFEKLISDIELFIEKCNVREFEMSIFNTPVSTNSVSSNDQHQFRRCTNVESRFLCFSIFHSLMISMPIDKNAKEKMVRQCKEDFKNNRMLPAVHSFEQETFEKNRKYAIRWYTRCTFVHRCVNTAFRKENLAQIYTYRYMIKLICEQLKTEHERYLPKWRMNSSTKMLRVYRGQQLLLKEINSIKEHRGKFLSCNGFFSSTTNPTIAEAFCFRKRVEGLKHVIFIVDIDMTKENGAIFADISELSRYDEEEILFSVGTIFRVESVKFKQTRDLYEIYLTLADKDNLNINRYLEQTYCNDANPNNQALLFGRLLVEMDEIDFAQEFITDMLNDSRVNEDDNLRAAYLNNLGVCYNKKGQNEFALERYRHARRIYEQAKNMFGNCVCLHNIASIYFELKKYEKAEKYALEVLNNGRSNKAAQASSYDLIGCISLERGNIENAEDNFKTAYKLRQRLFSRTDPNHPDIGRSFQNLGTLCLKKYSFLDAVTYFDEALTIYRYNYEESNPVMQNIIELLAGAKRKLS